METTTGLDLPTRQHSPGSPAAQTITTADGKLVQEQQVINATLFPHDVA